VGRRLRQHQPRRPACPALKAKTRHHGAEVGEIVVCPDCGVDLEVVSLNPAALEVAPMEQEDWGE
ncbi:MAG: lysine biosynthesis protein LysW, partial [Anaerolineales bacterium]